MEKNNWLVVSNIFYFHPYLGKIPRLTNIFQLGWNHQLEQRFLSFDSPLGSVGGSNLRHHRFPNTNFATLSTMTDWPENRAVGGGEREMGSKQFFFQVKKEHIKFASPEYLVVLVVPVIKSLAFLKGLVFIVTSNTKRTTIFINFLWDFWDYHSFLQFRSLSCNAMITVRNSWVGENHPTLVSDEL